MICMDNIREIIRIMVVIIMVVMKVLKVTVNNNSIKNNDNYED